MAILRIKKYPEQVLKTPAKKVDEITPSLVTLATDMLETMYAAPGVGLAAPQVGYSLQLAVIDTRHRNEKGQVDIKEMTELEREVPFPLKLFNPILLKKEGKIFYDEGCLSVPGFVEPVPRSEYVECEALDPNGERLVIKSDGLLAICIQHEIDHLNGKLFIDRLSTIKRGLIKTRIKKHGFESGLKDK